MFADAMDLLNAVNDPELYKRFRSRAQQILHNTRHTGWGIHDSLTDEFYSKYSNPDE